VVAGTEKAENLIDGEGAGDFTGGGATHAVANDVDTLLDREAECVFVGRSFATAIGNRGSYVIDYSQGQESSPTDQSTQIANTDRGGKEGT
jgi:hypothetical protein